MMGHLTLPQLCLNVQHGKYSKKTQRPPTLSQRCVTTLISSRISRKLSPADCPTYTSTLLSAEGSTTENLKYNHRGPTTTFSATASNPIIFPN
ncbi:uncharacterized protein TEOVI_000265300 [Trypanosoma equiperdum]|uniref:Uncharacterized protein n=2 Tax=Trypanozoon TaxID=39700 RepID=Q4GYU0_TRYB2|nr:hypothetical protein, unlikely [Trypanosoma brucei brucei TREU927]XP_001218981.1 hypothetical protein, unlikely [Trypanosoma brucei brucei TREU927]XP_001218984.1 hypothetical protein, unlikely [Trypanosoma brucei brucei TREU927]SCU71073.1 hypothetical protein, conserved [Trypanosoma equiperdum]CAJ16451.1 hypothetical protein, unlikely [Trypanosoma brucei brucei TREU927]CAJ16461.1 hypothetical protein, unlikely [Trypanosoma brucei brucei TREU927]CAJ16464.1 hypothetical protein, unlikely [Tr